MGWGVLPWSEASWTEGRKWRSDGVGCFIMVRGFLDRGGGVEVGWGRGGLPWSEAS